MTRSQPTDDSRQMLAVAYLDGKPNRRITIITRCHQSMVEGVQYEWHLGRGRGGGRVAFIVYDYAWIGKRVAMWILQPFFSGP